MRQAAERLITPALWTAVALLTMLATTRTFAPHVFTPGVLSGGPQLPEAYCLPVLRLDGRGSCQPPKLSR